MPSVITQPLPSLLVFIDPTVMDVSRWVFAESTLALLDPFINRQSARFACVGLLLRLGSVQLLLKFLPPEGLRCTAFNPFRILKDG